MHIRGLLGHNNQWDIPPQAHNRDPLAWGQGTAVQGLRDKNADLRLPYEYLDHMQEAGVPTDRAGEYLDHMSWLTRSDAERAGVDSQRYLYGGDKKEYREDMAQKYGPTAQRDANSVFALASSLFGAPGTGNTFQRKYHKDLGPTPPSVRFGLGRGEASVGSPELRAELEPIPNAPLILNDVQGDMRSRLSGMDIPSPSDVSALVGVDDSPRRQKLSPYDPQGPPPPPITAPMESGVSPRQSGFTGSLDWDVMDGNIYDSLGASVTETEEERRRREREERDQRSALASGFGRASEMLLAGGRREPVGPMANIGFPGYAGRSRRFA